MTLLLAFAFFLLTLTKTPYCSAADAIIIHNRRTLSQPFFPLASSSLLPTRPPSPSPAPSPSPSFPKYPSSSSSSISSLHPFFPLYPSSPPPSPPSPVSHLPTFPANISSFVSSPSGHLHPRLVSALVLSLLALLLLLGLSFAFFVYIRRRRGCCSGHKDAGSDSLRFFPPDTTASDGRKLSPSSSAAAPKPEGAGISSEFLYLGTLVSSRGRASESSNAGGGSPYRKLDSPELRPLPPLPRRNAGGGLSSDLEEEYCSPMNSHEEKDGDAAALGSGLKKAAVGVEMERCGSGSSTLSPPTNISSNGVSSPSRPSPNTSSPPPLRPPPLLRPPTPSPPKRRQFTISPPYSPPDADFNAKVNLWYPKQIGDFAGTSVAVGKTPLFGCPDGPNVKLPDFQPPVLGPPLSPGSWSFSTEPKGSNTDDKRENLLPMLKPLHWDKVPASSDPSMVWDQPKSGHFQKTTIGTKGIAGGSLDPSLAQESRILDPNKSQNISNLLKDFNLTKENVCEAILEGKADSLGKNVLEALTEMIPSRDEEIKLKQYKEKPPLKLGPAESFLKSVISIPYAFKRVVALLYISNFDSEVNYLNDLFRTLKAACEELKNSRMFHELLRAILESRNKMNVGTNYGEASAFKLELLLKLVDIKGRDGKTTLLHFVVQEISCAVGSRLTTINSSTMTSCPKTVSDVNYCKQGVQVVSSLGVELSNVKKAAAIDSDMLNFHVTNLGNGLGKIQEVVQLNDAYSNEDDHGFHETMLEFLRKAEDEILHIQAQESYVLSSVKELTEYFDGDSTKEEAHPFRIFVMVRDFLTILDQVCREIGKINERNIVAEQHLPTNQTSERVFPHYHVAKPGCSDDDERSLSC
ncbi:formin-like protein 1 isoform X2 [Zingiber officinale]|uniref:formin-like protein 1 isoform X2 n=1 Tax=Zingiber officinale TaxID=94328 RepID=UPI001C4AB285|nr:formin-like protein 1 isoform X2 [Zingiber officinale]